jgi:hypothetical protein
VSFPRFSLEFQLIFLSHSHPDHPFNTENKLLGVPSIPAPSIQLSKATQQFLEELMMEGDLLEVTLDETVYLWRLLNASKNYGNELEVIRKKYNIPVSCFDFSIDLSSISTILSPQLEMPTRIYSEDTVKKRKIMSGDEKPTRKYTKSIKQEIKKEPLEMSDGDPDDDDVMDIEEADGTLPKKIAKMNAKKRVMKTKKVKKVVKDGKEKDGVKVKPKRRKKPPVPPPVAATPATENTTPAKAATTTETPAKSAKKVPKVQKEKKVVKAKPQKPTKKPAEKEGAKTNNSDSDSSVEESDAYETCGVVKCQRPSGENRKSFEVRQLIC